MENLLNLRSGTEGSWVLATNSGTNCGDREDQPSRWGMTHERQCSSLTLLVDASAKRNTRTVLRVRSLSEHWQRDSEGTPHKLEGPLVTSSCSACTSLGGDFFCKPLMMAGSSQDIDRLFPLGGCKGCSVPLDGRKTRESAISFTDVFRRS